VLCNKRLYLPLWRRIEEFSQLFGPYWSLVETVRAADRPRRKTLSYLGEWNSSAQTRWLKTIEVFNDRCPTGIYLPELEDPPPASIFRTSGHCLVAARSIQSRYRAPHSPVR
jgi:hypothetical protein